MATCFPWCSRPSLDREDKERESANNLLTPFHFSIWRLFDCLPKHQPAKDNSVKQVAINNPLTLAAIFSLKWKTMA